MMIGGVSIILVLGILNMLLILFQISTGLRWLKIPFQVHRRTGITLFFSAAVHALLAFLANYG
jgi:hypothetical protein